MQIFVTIDPTKVIGYFDSTNERLGRALANWQLIAASEVVKEARKLAPYRTGKLRNSITATFKDTTVRVGSAVSYARYQEFGTRYIKPRRFLRGALEAKREYLIKLAQEFIGRQLRGDGPGLD